MTSENEFNFEEETSSNEEITPKAEEEQVPLPMETAEEETNVTSSEEFNTVKPVGKEKRHSQLTLDQSVIVEGKRSRKPTLRLDLTEPVPAKKELPIPQVDLIVFKEIRHLHCFSLGSWYTIR